MTAAANDDSPDATTPGFIAAALATTHDDASDHIWDETAEVDVLLDDAGGTVIINDPGAYRISGTLSDGQLVVDSDTDGSVWLILDGASITSSTSAAISIVDADKTIVWLEDGSQNTLADASEYVFASTDEDEPNAALFSRDDLTIAGTGSLTVEGNYNDGIASKDGLIIAGGDITVTAADDGIRGKDYLVVSGGSLAVVAQGDALKSDHEDDASLGYVSITGGVLDLTSGADAVEAVSAVIISGGDLSIAAADDGIHSEAWLAIDDGAIDITRSYEGLEGTQIVIAGGEVSVVADDDGLNVAGDESAAAGRPAGGNDNEVGIDGYFIAVSDGTIVVDAGGDGLDSNGSAYISGGTIVVNGSTELRDGALDVSGEFLVSGGTLLAAGSLRMAEAPAASSEQAVLDVQFSNVVPAGTVVRVEASGGTVVTTYEAPKDLQSMVLSTPDLVAGESYEVLLEGSVSGDSLGGLYLDADYTGGTSAGTLTAV